MQSCERCDQPRSLSIPAHSYSLALNMEGYGVGAGLGFTVFGLPFRRRLPPKRAYAPPITARHQVGGRSANPRRSLVDQDRR